MVNNLTEMSRNAQQKVVFDYPKWPEVQKMISCV